MKGYPGLNTRASSYLEKDISDSWFKNWHLFCTLFSQYVSPYLAPSISYLQVYQESPGSGPQSLDIRTLVKANPPNQWSEQGCLPSLPTSPSATHESTSPLANFVGNWETETALSVTLWEVQHREGPCYPISKWSWIYPLPTHSYTFYSILILFTFCSLCFKLLKGRC